MSDAVLIDAPTVAGALASDHPPVLLDVRWALGDPHGRDHYLAGHLPAAVFVDLDAELAGPPSRAGGRHPLPSIDALQAAARRWGVNGDRCVVVYDDTGGRAAARAWWLLRWAGHPDVRLLDGGLGAWTAAGYPIESGDVTALAGDVVLRPGELPVITADDAAGWPREGVLLDARPGARYRGEIEPVDSRPGHIPGARSAPTDDNLDSDGRFRPSGELAARYADLGVTPATPVAVYCGSGVTAAHDIAALAIAGIDAALFPGSWSAWSADSHRRAAIGPDPG